jgi:hypothetical protein
MNATLIKWLAAIIMAIVCAASSAEEFSGQAKEKFIGKWDNHSGIISFFTKKVDGAKQVRMLAADEHVNTKLSFDLFEVDLEDFEDLIENTLKEMGDSENSIIPPLGTKEVVKQMGKLDYPNGKIAFSIVEPAGATKYITLLVATKDKRTQCIYWMDREDLMYFKKLIYKVQKDLSVG